MPYKRRRSIPRSPVGPVPPEPKSPVSIGDRVKLSRGKTGIVKYKGPAAFVGGEEVIGIELDTWDPNAHDGSVQGKKYFDVCGYTLPLVCVFTLPVFVCVSV